MQSSLETVALLSLKLMHEEEGQSPILRDDPIMDEYQQEVFDLLLRRGDLASIQHKVHSCLDQALQAFGGVDKPLGRELHKLSNDFSQAQSVEQLGAPVAALEGYLRAAQ